MVKLTELQDDLEVKNKTITELKLVLQLLTFTCIHCSVLHCCCVVAFSIIIDNSCR